MIQNRVGQYIVGLIFLMSVTVYILVMNMESNQDNKSDLNIMYELTNAPFSIQMNSGVSLSLKDFNFEDVKIEIFESNRYTKLANKNGLITYALLASNNRIVTQWTLDRLFDYEEFNVASIKTFSDVIRIDSQAYLSVNANNSASSNHLLRNGKVLAITYMSEGDGDNWKIERLNEIEVDSPLIRIILFEKGAD